MTEQCQKCKIEDDELRTLEMACFYEMNELGLPFIVENKEIVKSICVLRDKVSPEIVYQKFYTLRVCKSCRASWMRAIQAWFNDQSPKPESCNSGIYIRKFGDIIEITKEEWDRQVSEKDKASR